MLTGQNLRWLAVWGPVIPAQAGIQCPPQPDPLRGQLLRNTFGHAYSIGPEGVWIPAQRKAGMTTGESDSPPKEGFLSVAQGFSPALRAAGRANG